MILYTGHFVSLEEQFIHDVTEQRKPDPLAPLDVLVTGQLVRLHLRRELARRGTAHANVRFYTLLEYARKIAGPELRKEQLVPLPSLARDAILKRVIDDAVQQLRYFGDASARPGFRRALWKTLDDLRHALLTPSRLRAAAESVDTSLSAVFARKLTDVALLWSRLIRIFDTHRLADEIRVFELAAAAPAREQPPLILYGFDSLSALERTVLQHPLKNSCLLAYVPHDHRSGGEWTAPFVGWLRTIARETYPLSSRSDDIPVDLHSLQASILADKPENTAEAPDQDGVRFISAPTAEREAEDVVRAMVASALAKETRRSTAILLRDEAAYTDLITEALTDCGLQGYVHRCRTLADTCFGKAAQRLSTLLDGRFRRLDVIEFISASGHPQAAEWSTWSLLAGICEGIESWSARLSILQRDITWKTAHTEETQSIDHKLGSITALSDHVERLSKAIDEILSATNWSGLRDRFVALLIQESGSDEDAEDFIDEMESASLLDTLGLKLSIADFRQLVLTALSRPVARSGKFQRDEPTVAGIATSLGVCYDDIYLPGLVEKGMPRPAPQDPLLTDADRLRLQDLTRSGELMTRRRAMDYERFLFTATLRSAKSRVVLSYPRLDAANHRERMASAYLLRAVESVTGHVLNYQQLDTWLRSSPRCHWVAIHRLQLTDAPVVSPFQLRLRNLAQALSTGSASPLIAGGVDAKALLRGAEMDWSRFATWEYSSFDGCVQDVALRQSIALRARAEKSHSVSWFQQYATCPFLFLGARLLGLSPLEESAPLEGLSALDRGLLIHDILDKFYRREHDGNLLPLQPAAWPRLLQVARACAREFEREHSVGPAALWSSEQRKLVALLRRWFESEMADDRAFVPQWFEQKFGRNDAAVSILLDTGEEIGFHGRVDRIDTRGQARARVIDYKTGTAESEASYHSLNGGRLLQAPIYLRAAGAISKLPVEQVEFRFLNGSRKTPIVYTLDHDTAAKANLLECVGHLWSGILSGDFHPAPEQDRCRSCEQKIACGTGRFTSKGGFVGSGEDANDE